MRVLKNFTTPSRRFSAGAEINAAALTGDAMTIQDRINGGFLEASDAPSKGQRRTPAKSDAA
ncbi:hypothetical protein ACM64Y_00630 [Novispirillum sp. DQ9]|uniref:hypothetical protein n=1 Tax=Novispirillum sp. DQ9 TaxID=3398612 RepID=UPI003C7BACE6